MKFSRRHENIILCFLVVVSISGCSTKKVMEDDHAKFKDINEEYNQVVKIDEIKAKNAAKAKKVSGQAVSLSEAQKAVVPDQTQAGVPISAGHAPTDGDRGEKSSAVNSMPEATMSSAKSAMTNKPVNPKVPVKILARQPKIEDSENFSGRRPLADPFFQNEKIVLSVNYFNVEAGEITMASKPFKMVNDRKAYHYLVNVKSNKVFSMFYAVDNTAETFVYFENLLPLTFSINMKESSRLKEVRMFFDRDKNWATHWEKTVKKNEDEKKKKKEWEIEPYAQNVISAIFYLRNFTLRAGKKLAFYVADDGKNLTFRGEVVREEKLKTPIGELETVVVKLNFELDDQFKQTGDNLIWLTKDEHRYIVRIESKVKIGSLVAKLKSIQPGTP